MIETDAQGLGIQVDDLDADWLLSLIEDSETQSRIAERRKLRYAAQWCRLHPVEAYDDEDIPVGGDGTPPVQEFAAEPLGAALQTSTYAARQLMADALDLEHRLPLIWARVEALEIPAWRARRIAQATSQLPQGAAAAVDRELVAGAGTCGTTLIDRAIARATADLDPGQQEADETLSEASWEVRLFHGPATGPGRLVGTSVLQITGDTLDLTRIHDQLTASADLATAINHLAARADGGRPARTKLFLHARWADLTDDTIGVGSVERLGPISTRRSGTGSATATSPCSPCCARTAPTPSTATTHPPGCASSSSSATPTAPSPGAAETRDPATSTTSSPTSRWTTAAHQARPTPATSPLCVEDTTARRPNDTGPIDESPTPPTPGPRPTTAGTSSHPQGPTSSDAFAQSLFVQTR